MAANCYLRRCYIWTISWDINRNEGSVLDIIVSPLLSANYFSGQSNREEAIFLYIKTNHYRIEKWLIVQYLSHYTDLTI